MAWYLDGTRIYVEEDTGWIPKVRLGELNILDSTQTVIHKIGVGSYTRTLQFVVFDAYKVWLLDNALLTTVPLISDQGAEGNVEIKSISADRIQALNYAGPVSRITVELVKNP